MEMDIKKLDQFLALDYLSLDLKGSNIDDFYQIRFGRFLLDYSEFPIKEKLKIYFSGQYNDKTELTIDKVHSERTFIDDQIVKCERYLKEPIHPDNREKLTIWVDYLKLKQKAIIEIRPEIPKWSVAKIALYYVYHDVKITDKNKAEKARALGHEHFSELKNEYDHYKSKGNRVFNNYDPKDKERKAEAVKGHLQDLKLIMEYRGEKDTKAYQWLIEELDELMVNMGQK